MNLHDTHQLLSRAAEQLTDQPELQSQLAGLRDSFQPGDFLADNLQAWGWQSLDMARGNDDCAAVVYLRTEEGLTVIQQRSLRGKDRLSLARTMLQELADYHSLDERMTVAELLDEDAVANGERPPPIEGEDAFADD